MNFFSKVRGFQQLFHLKGDPDYIARGFALGSFIGMLPIPGFQMLLSLSLATAFRVNRIAACIGVFNTNVATGAFVFAFNFWLGKTLLGLSPDFRFPDRIGFGFLQHLLRSGSEVFFSMLLGGLITGVFAWLVSFYGLRHYLQRKQTRS